MGKYTDTVRQSRTDQHLLWTRTEHADGSWTIRLIPQSTEHAQRLAAILGPAGDPSRRTITLDQEHLRAGYNASIEARGWW